MNFITNKPSINMVMSEWDNLLVDSHSILNTCKEPFQTVAMNVNGESDVGKTEIQEGMNFFFCFANIHHLWYCPHRPNPPPPKKKKFLSPIYFRRNLPAAMVQTVTYSDPRILPTTSYLPYNFL